MARVVRVEGDLPVPRVYRTGLEQREAHPKPAWQNLGLRGRTGRNQWLHNCTVRGAVHMDTAQIRDFRGCSFCGAGMPRLS